VTSLREGQLDHLWKVSLVAVLCLVAFGVGLLSSLSAPAALASSPSEVGLGAGIYEITKTYGATVFDYDGDGRPDILLGRHYAAPPRLYRNNGDGTFTDLSPLAFPATVHDRHGCDAADVNQDGLSDLYCATGGHKGGWGTHWNELWLQRPDGSFTQQSEAYGVDDPYGRGREVAFLDANGDPYPDLYVGNTYPRKDRFRSPNRVFINKAGQAFRPAPELGLDREIGAFSVQAIDFDGKWGDDLLVCGHRANGVTALHLYRQLPDGRFLDATRRWNASGRCKFARLADMNGDRRPDLIVLSRTKLKVKIQRVVGRSFAGPRYVRSADARDFAVGDVNGDHRNDIFLQHAGPAGHLPPDMVLLNHRRARGFTRLNVPQPAGGVADAVTPIDYDGNGLTDFVVENGRNKAEARVELIAFH